MAVAVNDDGRREVLGVATGPSEAETFWTDFLRSLADRGLRGVKLVIADDHKGLRAAARRVFDATHQRCRVHWMRNALAHAPMKQRAAAAAMGEDDCRPRAGAWIETGRGGRAGSSSRSRSCGRAHIFRAFSSRGGRPRRRSWR